MIVVAVICLFFSTINAADDCDSEYLNLINEVKNSKKILDTEKEKYLPPLEKAYQLCKEGKPEEADKIVKDLKNQGLSEEVFEHLEGN
jgi:pentatricopeptide repeat protein